ncbi:MAG: polysaccharide deacetylase family protein [Xanthobacteraceae bacterium]|nr:polysaccharide deacetylase family protein [Xanthobacteraceae bacterium]
MRAIVVYGVSAVALVGLGIGSLFIGGSKSTAPDVSQTAAAAKTGPVEATAALAPASKVQVMAQAPAVQPPQPTPMPRLAEAPCQNPGALGVARVVEIDTSGGPGFGFQHFKAYDFLNPGEVVFTFDDGPWPGNTPAVLAALAAQCTKATFFSIGKHAIWHPEILKQVAAAGHTVGSHTWSHADLSKKTPEEAKDEIEKGMSAVHAALGGPVAPFFRFPTLRQPQEMVTYLEGRNIAMFSTDVDSFDFKIHKEDQLITSVMSKLKKQGKGIILMHDFQHGTAQALPQILADLKAAGFKVVHLRPKSAAETLPEYDAMMSQEIKGGTANAKPTNSVVRTVEGN